MAIVNPHASMIAYDIDSKDHNQQRVMANQREKTNLILATLERLKGLQKKVVNVRTGEVRTWEFSTNGQGQATRHARVNVIHLLFGDWRIASPEDIARQDKKDQIYAENMARMEAAKKAKAAGMMFEELSKASESIQRFNAAQIKADASAAATTPPATGTEPEKEKTNKFAPKKAKE